MTAPVADNTYDVSQNGVYITQNGSYFITGSTTTNPITVGNGQDPVPVTITLSNVTIDLSGRSGIAFNIQSGSDVVLTLEGINTLISGTDDVGRGIPGIHLPEGTSLTIQGSGSLTVTGGKLDDWHGGAGIGGGVGGAGIGSGTNSGTGSDVTIIGGSVTITGGNGSLVGGAGIGGGACSYGNRGADAGTVIILSPVTVRGGTGGDWDGVNIGGGQSTSGSAGGNGQGIRPGADGTYEAYGGSFALPDGLVIPGGATVTVPEGIVLTVPESTTLTNNGTITGAGGLTVEGDVKGSGSQSLTGTVTKKDQAGSPAAPTTRDIGSISVTLETQSGGVAGVEYACVKGADAAAPTEEARGRPVSYLAACPRRQSIHFLPGTRGMVFITHPRPAPA